VLDTFIQIQDEFFNISRRFIDTDADLEEKLASWKSATSSPQPVS